MFYNMFSPSKKNGTLSPASIWNAILLYSGILLPGMMKNRIDFRPFFFMCGRVML